MKTRRIAGMIGGGLALALALFAGISLSDRKDGDDRDTASGPVSPVAASLTPVSFTRVSETQTAEGAVLRLSGLAEPASVIALLDRGERILQVRASAQGVWSAMVDVSGQGMAIEAILYDTSVQTGGAVEITSATSIRGVETIFRIHRPTEEQPDAPALIMISAPGAPTRLIQSPFGGIPASGPLAIGAVDYDDAGGVIFSGLSEVQGSVRLSVANAVIGDTRVGPDGRWAYIASSVMPLGEYAVRAELIDGPGAGANVSVPFERLPPLPATESDDGTLSVSFEPFRWQIRRSLIGGGMQSTAIFAPE
ncbi:hypothetical protein ACFFUB_07440 [Algimonas porphyrae]|uniref:Bacterial spore germination immunoglobulin-like domain-containing protein n=1 Tax=Algimonas porphyrae TaxID=1128113 RepID=A0ABQ5V0G7_9PROT|nr:hypothetical protein [Algimonas porphyrae]GLQ20996.1 hypothetical protein GCM10007854_19510 [Algimonas porphyrae]